jgi:hypothetical protein
VLTDKDGFTLYRFDKDTAKPPKSSWRRDCAKAWRPVLSQGSIDVQGVAAGVVGKVTRTDGSGQSPSVVAGLPLRQNTQPGEAKGHGVGGTWFAIEPNGCESGGTPGVGHPAPAAGYNYRFPVIPHSPRARRVLLTSSGTRRWPVCAVSEWRTWLCYYKGPSTTRGRAGRRWVMASTEAVVDVLKAVNEVARKRLDVLLGAVNATTLGLGTRDPGRAAESHQ